MQTSQPLTLHAWFLCLPYAFSIAFFRFYARDFLLLSLIILLYWLFSSKTSAFPCFLCVLTQNKIFFLHILTFIAFFRKKIFKYFIQLFIYSKNTCLFASFLSSFFGINLIDIDRIVFVLQLFHPFRAILININFRFFPYRIFQIAGFLFLFYKKLLLVSYKLQKSRLLSEKKRNIF